MSAPGQSGGWQTIESDAGVFTHLVEQLGVKDVQFEELLSLEVEDLRALSPLHGIIFLFKFPVDDPSVYQDSKDQPPDGQYEPSAVDHSGLFFAHQSIQNACGTQAVLSVLLNKDRNEESTTAATTKSTAGETSIDIGPTLRSFAQFTSSFPPSLRGDALSNSSPIRRAHNAFARSNPFVDEVARDPDASQSEDVFHFVAYVPVNGILYELDGLREHPISHGSIGGADAPDFPSAIVPILQRRIARYPAGEIHFNLLALTRDLRIKAREEGDTMALAREEEKRRGWAWENELRAWGGWVGFTGTVLRETVAQKVRGGVVDGYDKWVEEARGRTKTRVQTKGRLKD